jgi:hypothetical protein
MMRFGEVSVRSRASFNGTKHLKWADVLFDRDLNGKHYARLDLPSAKTAATGEIQSIFLVEQQGLCPLDALENLARVVPAGPNDPLFSWMDGRGNIRPMVRDTALDKINTIVMSGGWGTMFGHSFRIGGASFFLAQGVSLEMVRIAGRWKSLAYQAYIQAFELVASRHLSNISPGDNVPPLWWLGLRCILTAVVCWLVGERLELLADPFRADAWITAQPSGHHDNCT